MKSIVLIRTAKDVAVSFDQMLRREIGTDLAVHNLWDDYLVDDPNERGEFTTDNRNCLLLDIKTRELTRADLIVTTCLTLIPMAEMIRPFIKVPVIAIGGAMAKANATYGKRVLIVTTTGSTVYPTVSKIEREGETAGKKLSTDTCVYTQAFQALKTTDMEKHGRILTEKTEEFVGCDYIVLAQASIAHLEYEIAAVTGCPMPTNPRPCMGEIKQKLASLC